MHEEIISRINEVIDHIERHIGDKHKLDELAGIAHLSKFHFHRTFKIITQETPNEYINRKRVERIASLLVHNPGETISDLSFRYGFQNLSHFSRTFKKRYGFSASELVKGDGRVLAGSFENSKIGKTGLLYSSYLREVENLKKWADTNAEIQMRPLPEIKLAYVRHWGSPYAIHQAFDKLLEWCENVDEKNIGNDFYILFHDNPNLTDEYKIQQSASVEIKGKIDPKYKISMLTIPPQQYLIGNFLLKEDEFEKAWNTMVVWLNDKNLRSGDGYRFERFSQSDLLNKVSPYRVQIAIPITRI